jgi:thymidylate kinase
MGVGLDASQHQLPTTRLANAIKRGREASAQSPATPPSGLRRRVGRTARSALRLSNRMAEEWYRQLLANRHLRRGRIVVFDRHFTADYHAADVLAPRRTLVRRLHGLMLTRLYPVPDLVIFLDAPAEVLFARKHEGSVTSLERRRAEYRRFISTLDNVATVDATQPLDGVIAQVAEMIRDHGAKR